MPRAKMLGNMMELNRPTATIEIIATCSKATIDMTTRTPAMDAAAASTRPMENLRKMAEPMKRPTSHQIA